MASNSTSKKKASNSQQEKTRGEKKEKSSSQPRPIPPRPEPQRQASCPPPPSPPLPPSPAPPFFSRPRQIKARDFEGLTAEEVIRRQQALRKGDYEAVELKNYNETVKKYTFDDIRPEFNEWD
ncbi:hypothetical protein QBC38DRAFT_447105 [Podospora fimiseda]|uniref:Uncharacterized protein n=1 Tax=Podospora fimiseda TaxID=252190 RepID=A0AAN7GSR6_9PEZI|nr:hypothetical protein QBC38DRAFT_447105 [Podospora fimiseda]